MWRIDKILIYCVYEYVQAQWELNLNIFKFAKQINLYSLLLCLYYMVDWGFIR